jgi:alkanesulfonate monooxygenase SsuD/methylene tetrahydromethanopterin reductase-like flavin-dependent oxidoreductase (luciferase family)
MRVELGSSEEGGPSLGLVMPTFPQEGGAPWNNLAEWSSRAERAGADALWTCDHLFWEGPNLDPLVALAFAAEGTSRCALGPGVLQLPLRTAASVAKAAASLQVLSGGRMLLGVGLGEHEGEYEAASVPYEGRGDALDAGIAELRRHWAPRGERYAQRPAPDPIPVWVGGSSVRARRRAARLGDGWMPLFIPEEELEANYDALDAELEAAGRDPSSFVRSLMVFVSAGEAEEARAAGSSWLSSLYGLPSRSFSRHLVAGEPAECAQMVARLGARGVEHLVLFITADEPLAQFEALVGALSAVRA